MALKLHLKLGGGVIINGCVVENITGRRIDLAIHTKYSDIQKIGSKHYTQELVDDDGSNVDARL